MPPPDTTEDREDFTTWLELHGYRNSTLRKTVSEVRCARAEFKRDGAYIIGNRRASLLRYVKFLSTQGGNDGFDAGIQEALVVPDQHGKGLRGNPQRKLPARSFQDQEHDALIGRLEADAETHPEAQVLYVQALTGWRVGDVLRLPRTNLKAALREGVLLFEVKAGRVAEMDIAGLLDVWQGLYDRWPEQYNTMERWVCPNGHAGTLGAYQRVRRYLLGVSSELKIDSRVHTHRFRRTMAVRGLKETGDINAVKQLLFHSSIQSTEKYLDEVRREDTAALQRKLRRQRTHGHHQEEARDQPKDPEPT